MKISVRQYDKLDEILDNYWLDIKKGEELVTTIQARYRDQLLKLIDIRELFDV